MTPAPSITRWTPGRKLELVDALERGELTFAAQAIKVIDDIKRELGLSLVTRHVKGHVAERVGRSWVNDQCDRTAKKHMRAKRLELQPQPQPQPQPEIAQ